MRALGNGIAPTILTGNFTATLLGVVSTPTATMNYTIQQYVNANNAITGWGQFVTLSLGNSTLLGTSTGNSMQVSGLPSILNGLAANNNYTVPCMVEDNGIILLGTCDVSGNANLVFNLLDTSIVANRIIENSTGFTSSGSKGLPLGWFIQYPLA